MPASYLHARSNQYLGSTLRVIPRTFRFLPGGTTPSKKAAEARLRFVGAITTAPAEDWDVVRSDKPECVGFVSIYVFVGILG